MQLLEELKVSFDNYKSSNPILGKIHSLYDPIRHLLSSPGKGIRPIMTLLGGQLFSENITPIFPAALAIEYFHNFTLMHDDIMDDAPLRRGIATVHKKYGSNTAILSGDTLLILAYQELEKVKAAYQAKVFIQFNKTAIEVCEGQQMDIDFENKASVSNAQYIEMIRLKTSVLMGTALKIGAILGGAPTEMSDLLYSFGTNLGIAFQIQDDILDCYGTSAQTGKQIGGDIILNKKTFLLNKAIELSNSNQDDSLSKIINTNWDSKTEKIEKVLAIYDKYQVKEAMIALREEYVQLSTQQLNQLKINKEGKSILESLINLLVYRKK